MSIFGSIVDKIVHFASGALAPQASAASAPAQPAAAQPATNAAPSAPAASAPAPAAGAAPASAPLAAVDVPAVLEKLDSQKGGGLNWQTSIVDLLKLLDLDSSLDARKTLANELNVHDGADGTAEQNVALHKAVVARLAENGGHWVAAH